MFVSQEGAARKPFQKPNILRRRSKAAKLNIEKSHESLNIGSPLCSGGSEVRLAPIAIPLVQTEEQQAQQFQIIEAPTFAVVSIEQIYNQNGTENSQTLDFSGDSLTIYAHNTQVNSDEICIAQDTLNVESFLNSDVQSKALGSKEDTSASEAVNTDNTQKWCLDFITEESKETTSYYDDDGSLISNTKIENSPNNCDVMCDVIKYGPVQESLLTPSSSVFMPISVANTHPKTIDNYSIRKFVCEEPTCKKSYWTEANLEKHKKTHKGEKNLVILKCPVSKTDSDGVETKCGRTFLARNMLTKHLNEEHSPEDALFKCGKCGRRFWYAGGARTHATGGCGRAYACAWPGCGRVFRQPCRLREHARAHTGDRPYACHFPGCNWSFRSNSKLVRHARRHTGERRHTCADCGRSFLRREHLREHAARHHAAPHHRHACTHPDCNRSFMSTSSLVSHVKKVHMVQDKDGKTPSKRQKSSRAKKDTRLAPAIEYKPQETIETTIIEEPCEQILETIEATPIETMRLEQDGTIVKSTIIERASSMEGEERCARVHCTWPLQRGQDTHFTLEEDTQVEQAGSESCESNIYSVRSDLFLHGNLLANDDTEFIISRGSAGECGAAGGEEGARGTAPLDALLDSHPTTDLTQEELMYADAVDESSFRVFLLNGEELA